MEKMHIGRNFISDDKIRKYINEIKLDSFCLNFINKNKINDLTIENNILIFQHVISDRTICKDCKGINSCSKKIKGLVKELEFIDGNVVEFLNPCSYQQKINKLEKFYLIRDFNDSELTNRLTPSDIDDFRKGVANRMGRTIKGLDNKGVYIFGKTGVGKTYLSICLANSVVDQEKTVAFINARKSISLLRGLVMNEKEKFEEYIDRMKNAELLIIDDLGNEKITDWSRDGVLYEVLDYRLRNRKTKIIINSNYTLEELKELYKVDNDVRTKRFISLLRSVCDEVELIGINRFL